MRLAAKIDRERAITLHRGGATPGDIAQMFGVKPPAITRILRAAGINLRPKRDAHRDALADLVSEGLTIRLAAQKLGIAPRTGDILWAEICSGLGWQAS